MNNSPPIELDDQGWANLADLNCVILRMFDIKIKPQSP